MFTPAIPFVLESAVQPGCYAAFVLDSALPRPYGRKDVVRGSQVDSLSCKWMVLTESKRGWTLANAERLTPADRSPGPN